MTPPAGTVDRALLVTSIQRFLTPFLSTDEIAAHLAEIEAAGALDAVRAGERYFLVEALNECFYGHRALFEARERRSLGGEADWFDRQARGALPDRPVVYRIEQRVTIADLGLPESSLLQLFLPAPREVPGVQRCRLLAAEPAGLAEHYLARAGQIYGAPFLIEAGERLEPLRLVYEVEREPGAGAPLSDPDVRFARRPVPPEAAAWAEAIGIPADAPARARVAALLDRIEEDLLFAVTGPVAAPVPVLLAAGAGDVHMHAALIADALDSIGIRARVGAAQRLALAGGRSHLRYPGSTGFDHAFVEWRENEGNDGGVVDPFYLSRWNAVIGEDNATPALCDAVDAIDGAARGCLREQLYPIDLVLAGTPPPSRVHCFASNETLPMPAPVDVELVAEQVER